MVTHQISTQYQPPDLSILTGLSWGNAHLDHEELSNYLADKHPYTITIILDNLDWKLLNRQTYVLKTRHARISRYRELLYQALYREFSESAANEQYRLWLDKYRQRWLNDHKTRDLDDYILESEMIPRYHQSIMKRYKNLEKLKQPRSYIRRERYYTLPEPINGVDWRSPYDNLFIWTEGGRRCVDRGGSGSSQARETNSCFIYALGLLNQKQPVTSSLYLYDKTNQLHQLHSFSSLTMPKWDIGSNYHLDPSKEKQALKGVNYLWRKDVAELTKLYLVSSPPFMKTIFWEM